MNDKYTLFLCGGKWQLPWFKFLKNKGHKLILVDERFARKNLVCEKK